MFDAKSREVVRVQLRRGVLALDRFLEGLLVGLFLSDEVHPSIVELFVRGLGRGLLVCLHIIG